MVKPVFIRFLFGIIVQFLKFIFLRIQNLIYFFNKPFKKGFSMIKNLVVPNGNSSIMIIEPRSSKLSDLIEMEIFSNFSKSLDEIDLELNCTEFLITLREQLLLFMPNLLKIRDITYLRKYLEHILCCIEYNCKIEYASIDSYKEDKGYIDPFFTSEEISNIISNINYDVKIDDISYFLGLNSKAIIYILLTFKEEIPFCKFEEQTNWLTHCGIDYNLKMLKTFAEDLEEAINTLISYNLTPMYINYLNCILRLITRYLEFQGFVSELELNSYELEK
jgi:hypothetical protein